jgi:hypothetical protein
MKRRAGDCADTAEALKKQTILLLRRRLLHFTRTVGLSAQPTRWRVLDCCSAQWAFKKSSTTDRKRSALSICMAWLALGITTVCGKLRHFLISS